MDTQSMTLSAVGAFAGLGTQLSQWSAELTGTPEGGLYGLFLGDPYVLAGIDKTSGRITSELPLLAIQAGPASTYAFSSWGQDFWFFVGNATATGIYHYDAATGATTQVTTGPGGIDGAGVSPCVQL